MPDWQAAAMRLADDYEELRQVHVAQQSIVEAATTLVEHWDNARSVQPTGTDYTGRNFQLLNALAAAVHGETK